MSSGLRFQFCCDRTGDGSVPSYSAATRRRHGRSCRSTNRTFNVQALTRGLGSWLLSRAPLGVRQDPAAAQRHPHGPVQVGRLRRRLRATSTVAGSSPNAVVVGGSKSTCCGPENTGPDSGCDVRCTDAPPAVSVLHPIRSRPEPGRAGLSGCSAKVDVTSRPLSRTVVARLTLTESVAAADELRPGVGHDRPRTWSGSHRRRCGEATAAGGDSPRRPME